MGKLKYDRDLLDYVEAKRSARYHLLRALKFAGITLALVGVYFVVFTLVFSSDEEKRMISENRLIEDQYAELESQTRLLEEAVEELGRKDEDIYRQLFNTDFPDFSFADSSSVTEVSGLSYGREMTGKMARSIARLDREYDYCDRLIAQINSMLDGAGPDSLAHIPSILPIADFPLGNVGASVGRKMHPFYKEMVYHGGLDLVAPVGVEVRATADGTVKSVAISAATGVGLDLLRQALAETSARMRVENASKPRELEDWELEEAPRTAKSDDEALRELEALL